MDDQRRDELWWRVTQEWDTSGEESWSHAVCAVAVSTIEIVDGAVLTMRSGKAREENIAASSPWVRNLAELQYALGEGPTPAAFESGEPLLVDDLEAAPDRWHAFTDAALAAGLCGIWVFPLRFGGMRIGTLTLAGRRPGTFDADFAGWGAALADIAVVCLLSDFSQAEDQTQYLMKIRPSATDFGERYYEVHIATGMVAAQLRISLHDAFARLGGHAFAENRSLLDVAKDVVERRLRLDQSGE